MKNAGFANAEKLVAMYTAAAEHDRQWLAKHGYFNVPKSEKAGRKS